jgi:hypothetical protein
MLKTRPEERTPTFESRVHRYIKTDLHGEDMVDRVVKFRVRNILKLYKQHQIYEIIYVG